MAKPIKNKKQTKTSRKGKRLSSKIQKGGVSNSCVLNYAANMSSPSTGFVAANLHNLNPQAAGDLDHRFTSLGPPVPLGQMGGANKCGDDGVGTSKPKSQTFKQYLNTLDKQLSFKGGDRNNNNNNNNSNNNRNNNNDSNNNDRNSNDRNSNDRNSNDRNSNDRNSNDRNSNDRNSNNNMLKGGDYTVNPEEYIAGQPVIYGYDHENPPAIISGKLVMTGAGVNRQVCGNGATRGGSRKSKRKSHKKSKSNKKHKRTQKTQRKQRKQYSSSSKMQKGGDFVSIGSKPADYADAFSGPAGIFKYPDDMSTRDFAAKQPNYGVNAI